MRSWQVNTVREQWPFGWSSPDLVIWETHCNDHHCQGTGGSILAIHRETRAEEQLPVARIDAVFLLALPSIHRSGQGMVFLVLLAAWLGSRTACSPSSGCRLGPIQWQNSWNRHGVGVTIWLPMCLAPCSGCVPCHSHVNPPTGRSQAFSPCLAWGFPSKWEKSHSLVAQGKQKRLQARATEPLPTNRPAADLQGVLAAGLLLPKPGEEVGSPACMSSA